MFEKTRNQKAASSKKSETKDKEIPVRETVVESYVDGVLVYYFQAGNL
jgi:hypothetical protein